MDRPSSQDPSGHDWGSMPLNATIFVKKISQKKEKKRKKAKKKMFCLLPNRCSGGFERYRTKRGTQLKPGFKYMIITSPIVTAVIYLLVSSRILNIFSVF